MYRDDEIITHNMGLLYRKGSPLIEHSAFGELAEAGAKYVLDFIKLGGKAGAEIGSEAAEFLSKQSSKLGRFGAKVGTAIDFGDFAKFTDEVLSPSDLSKLQGFQSILSKEGLAITGSFTAKSLPDALQETISVLKHNSDELVQALAKTSDELGSGFKLGGDAAEELVEQAKRADEAVELATDPATKASKSADAAKAQDAYIKAKGDSFLKTFASKFTLGGVAATALAAFIIGQSVSTHLATNNKKGNITKIIKDPLDEKQTRVGYTPEIPLFKGCTVDIIDTNCDPKIDGDGQQVLSVAGKNIIHIDREIKGEKPEGATGSFISHSTLDKAFEKTVDDLAETAADAGAAFTKAATKFTADFFKDFFKNLGINIPGLQWWLLGSSGCVCLCLVAFFVLQFAT